MYSKELLLLVCACLLGGLHLTSTTTTTTFVAAMSIANQDLGRYFRSANSTHTLATMTEERILLETYTFAYLNYSYIEDGITKYVNFSKEQARYGEGKMFSVFGKLVHISDATNMRDDTACSPNIRGTNGNDFPDSFVPWIALVRRGRCTFEEKVKNVYERGAAGVIVYNDKPVMNLDKMQIKGQSRNITAVITYNSIGLEMAEVADRGLDVDAAIIKGSEGSRPINTLNRTSVLFVSISFIVLMVLSLVWLIFYYIQRFRYLHNKDQQSRHLCSVTKKAIMKIPTKTGKSSDEKDLDSDCCAICIETYKSSDCIRVLPCKHEFHKNCIDPWLIEHRTCPMCKLDVLKFYGYVFLGSEESILEYEPDRHNRNRGAEGAGTDGGGVGAGAACGPSGHGTALAELMQSSDFVIDFPRVFILEAGGATGTRDTLFPARLPERSQSSLSLAGHAKDWISNVSNKLDEQHGLQRFRKRLAGDAVDTMEQHLLDVRDDSVIVKRRRSKSADGRYSNVNVNSGNRSQLQVSGGERRNSATLRILTEAAYAQSKQRRQREEVDFAVSRRRAIRRPSGMDGPPYPECTNRRDGNLENTPPADVSITIQVNGEGVEIE